MTTAVRTYSRWYYLLELARARLKGMVSGLESLKTAEDLMCGYFGFNGGYFGFNGGYFGFNALLSIVFAAVPIVAVVALRAAQRCSRWCRNRLELVPNSA